MATLVYGVGALRAGERRDRPLSALHDECLRAGLVPVVPAGVLAQAWRGGSGEGPLEMLLAGCRVEPLDEQSARAVGELAAVSAMADLADLSVVECAIRRRAAVVTAEPAHVEHIARAAGTQVRVAEV
jgi:hypothetical protein